MELGSYSNAQGGRIYLNLAENAEWGTMFGTVQHETAHAWLMGTTMLGTLTKLLYMEMLLSEDTDQAYSRDRKACVRLLAEYTRAVQEIYANNMELLSIENQFGREEMLHALKQRPEEYQGYFMEMWPVHQSGLSFPEKQHHIYAVCRYAMNPVPEAETLHDAYALAKYLQGSDNPLRRLRYAVNNYQTNGNLPENDLDEPDMLRYAERTLKYIKPYLHDIIAQYDQILENLSKTSAADTVDQLMMDKICLFEPEKIRAKRVWNACDAENTVFLVMKNVLNLHNEDHFYLLRYDEKCVGEEVDARELERRIGKCVSVCTLMSDYDPEKEQPRNFEQGQAFLTVLIQTSSECAQWLQKKRCTEAVCVGELRSVSDRTDISILFFSLRGKPEKVYVFPTLRAIRNRILTDFGLESRCYQANEAIFLSLLSGLKDEIGILKYLQGLLQLLLRRNWQEIQKQDTLRQFIAAIGNNLANQALRFKRNDYYKVMAALPLKETQNAPLFVLMRFEGERNTGDIYADSNSRAPFLFLTKAAADAFSASWADGFSSVGVDQIFWPYFKRMTGKGKAVLVLDATKGIGKLVDTGEIEAVLYEGRNNRNERYSKESEK